MINQIPSKKALLFLLLLTLPAIGHTESNNYSGNELLADCNEYISAVERSEVNKQISIGRCAGFVVGVYNTIFVYDIMIDKNDEFVGKYFCPPEKENVTDYQLVLIVIRYLKNNPEMLSDLAATSAFIAITNTFYCHKK